MSYCSDQDIKTLKEHGRLIVTSTIYGNVNMTYEKGVFGIGYVDHEGNDVHYSTNIERYAKDFLIDSYKLVTE